MKQYVVLEKAVGETPLQCTEKWRVAAGVDASVPLAYAGRLDPMASGKLLVLIGDECKNQTNYHGLDKGYDFSVLLGIGSDTHDVLGRLVTEVPTNLTHSLPRRPSQTHPSQVALSLGLPELQSALINICQELEGEVELPYPYFSAKTVQGKPLHMWTLEGRLDEIEIPTKASNIYSLELIKIETKTREEVAAEARAKIDTVSEVTDPKKALGADFRRVDVRKDWAKISEGNFGPVPLPDFYHIVHFHCIASSGTYMRTLAKVIAKKLNTVGLAWHIHRTNIGTYDSFNQNWGFEY